ncbi:MAG: DUF1015 domain-containing protein [Firmicutes bacterium]|nr:DUF1015 domain-containing protein [Bacillota bacterium]
MVKIRAFAAVRPADGLADKVAALPYDVMNSDEARQMVQGNPYSFLHIDKAEIDLPAEVDLYADEVYAKAAANLAEFTVQGVLKQDTKPNLYVYAQTMNGRRQVGLVACTAVDDYQQNLIKKHEFTRADKEADRIRHVDECDANTGPIFLTYRDEQKISAEIAAWIAAHQPLYDFVAEDGVGHTAWLIDDAAVIERLIAAFEQVPALYIADGHHRAASAVRVAERRRRQFPDYEGSEEFNFFLSVIFPAGELAIMDYNRVVRDLNGLTEQEFLQKLAEFFEVTPYADEGLPKPAAKHQISLLLPAGWYQLRALDGTFDEADPVDRLDVSILQKNVLAGLLGIEDPRTDKRIDFVGGIRGLDELVRRVEEGWAAAFAMYPTGLDDLMSIADSGQVMPPKSTWFEPKLRSGLFIHKLK